MIWFFWLIWIILGFSFIALGYVRENYLLKLSGGILFIFASLIIFSQGIEIQNGFNTYSNSSTQGQFTDIYVSNVPVYSTFENSPFSDALKYLLMFLGFGILLEASFHHYAQQKKNKRGSLEFGEDAD